jgi:F420H(2)-dependent quinone reductase
MAFAESAQAGFLRFHQAVYEATRGRIGHRMIGVPTLLLTTVGRRTGVERTAALVYAKDGDSFVVVASNGGADRPPGWLHNVKANPNVDVQVGTRRVTADAEAINPDHADYGRLWALVNANNHGRYDRYQGRTRRPIELVRLTPRGPGGGR